MGSSDRFQDMAGQARDRMADSEQADQLNERADEQVDQAAKALNEKTGGRFSDPVEKGAEKGKAKAKNMMGRKGQ